MKKRIFLILCVVCGVMATNSEETPQTDKMKFDDQVEKAISDYISCVAPLSVDEANQDNICDEKFNNQMNNIENEFVLTLGERDAINKLRKKTVITSNDSCQK